jgi:hypothetical protein
MADSSMTKTKYFNAVADNKRIDAGLKVYELRIDGFRKKAINRIWKTNFTSIFTTLVIFIYIFKIPWFHIYSLIFLI